MKHKLSTIFTLMIFLGVFGVAPALAGKQSICHFPPGNPGNFHTIVVSDNAVHSHVENHGDLVGSCQANCEAICDDGDFCTQDVIPDPETCICQNAPRPAVDCDDGNECTADSCDSGIGACLNNAAILDGESCGDPDPPQECLGGVCTPVSLCPTAAPGDDCPCDFSAAALDALFGGGGFSCADFGIAYGLFQSTAPPTPAPAALVEFTEGLNSPPSLVHPSCGLVEDYGAGDPADYICGLTETQASACLADLVAYSDCQN